MKNKKGMERGQVLILVAAGILGLVAIVAVAVDGGNAFMDRRHAQNAADAAVMAAALAKVNNQDWNLAGFGRAADNGYTNDGVRSTVTINIPPSANDCNPNDPVSPYLGNSEFIQVIIRSNVDTFFAPVVGIDVLHVCVQSIGRAKTAISTPMAFGQAIASLSCYDTDGFRIFNAHGNSILKVHGSGIFVNTTNSGGLYAGGSTQVWAPSYTTASPNPPTMGNFLNEGGTGGGTVTVGAARLDCPPDFHIPDPTQFCSGPGSKVGDHVTPGNIPASYLGGNAELAPGIYCITGSVNINAHDTIEGDGVLLYFINGSMDISGDAKVQLTSATSGTYAGLLMYSPFTNHTTFTINGNADSYYAGSIVLLGSLVRLMGTGNANGFHSQVIGDSVEYGGTSDGSIYYQNNQNYDMPVPPVIEIVE